MFLLCHRWLTTTNLSYSFLFLKLPPPPCAVLLVYIYIYTYKLLDGVDILLLGTWHFMFELYSRMVTKFDTWIHQYCPKKMLERIFDWVVVSNMFYFHPYLGKIPILTNIFQMGWNHQLVDNCEFWRFLALLNYLEYFPTPNPSKEKTPVVIWGGVWCSLPQVVFSLVN